MAEQQREDDRHDVLEDDLEHDRGDERVEDAAKHAADRDQQEVLGKARRMRPIGRQATVREQAGREQARQVQRHLDDDRDRDDPRVVSVSPATTAASTAPDDPDGDRDPRRERDDERQQVDRERDDPEKGHRRDVGRQVARHAQHQARRHERQEDPPRPASDRDRRECGRAIARGGSRTAGPPLGPGAVAPCATAERARTRRTVT